MTLSKKAYLQINQALFSLVNAYDVRARTEDNLLTVMERSVIMVLGQLAPINSRQLAEAMQLSPGPVSIHVQNLAEKGFVVRERDQDDRRNWWLSLTAGGEQAYQETLDSAVQYTRAFLSTLDEEELHALHRLLHKAAQSLGFEWQ